MHYDKGHTKYLPPSRATRPLAGRRLAYAPASNTAGFPLFPIHLNAAGAPLLKANTYINMPAIVTALNILKAFHIFVSIYSLLSLAPT